MRGQAIIKVASNWILIIALCCLAARHAIAQPGRERKQVVRTGSANLQVTIRGQGDPIVFVPSLGRGVQDFDAVSKRLVRAGYRAILPEPRGIGASNGSLDGITLHDLAADVAAVIRATGGGPAILVGHAFGNRVVRMVAADHPTLVKKVILLAAGGMVPMSAETEEAFNRVFNSTLPKADRIAAIQRAFFATGNNGAVWEEGWYFNVVAAQRAANRATPVSEWWGAGSAPVLVLQGAEDVVAVPQNSKSFAADYPKRVTLVEIANAGHAMLPEQPDRIVAAIVQYLKR